jgi:hypothetical protein
VRSCGPSAPAGLAGSTGCRPRSRRSECRSLAASLLP